MKFVNDFNFYGQETAKQIPCITGKGAPTETTDGAVGCFYMNTDNGDVYKCVSVIDGVYTWRKDKVVIEADQTYEPESTNAQSGKAVAEAVQSAVGEICVSTEAELLNAIANNIGTITLRKNAVIPISQYIELPEYTVLNGNSATLVRQAGFEGTLIRMLPNCRLYDLIIDGNRGAVTNPIWSETIEISTRANCIVENVRINNGNEAICACQDNVVIRNCKITNCSGNGIHFSGGINIKAENNYIYNVNRLWFENGESIQTIGHEDGGIIWSNLCDYVTCTGNYVENAKSVFGAIDSDDNSHIKLIGNTGKNCSCAIDTMHDSTVFNEGKTCGTPTDVIISENEFINCGELQVKEVSITSTDNFRFIISNNIFNNTTIHLLSARYVTIANNIMVNLTKSVTVQACKDIVISGNKISGNFDNLIYIARSENVNITDNILETSGTVIDATSANAKVIVKGNIAENPSSVSSTCLRLGNGVLCSGNRLSIKAGTGILVESNVICTDNMIICADTNLIAIRNYGGNTNHIVMNNLSNGAFQLSAGTESGIQSNNISCASLEYA